MSTLTSNRYQSGVNILCKEELQLAGTFRCVTAFSSPCHDRIVGFFRATSELCFISKESIEAYLSSRNLFVARPSATYISAKQNHKQRELLYLVEKQQQRVVRELPKSLLLTTSLASPGHHAVAL